MLPFLPALGPIIAGTAGTAAAGAGLAALGTAAKVLPSFLPGDKQVPLASFPEDPVIHSRRNRQSSVIGTVPQPVTSGSENNKFDLSAVLNVSSPIIEALLKSRR